MVFDSDELEAIVTRHLLENMHLTEDAIGPLCFRNNGIVVHPTLSVDVETENGVPQGPYRTPGRAT